VRTLVISDLHLGARLRRDVLRRAAPLDVLLSALEGVDRLVLLGDVVELVEGRQARQRALGAARAVLRSIAARLPAGAEVIVVPGNHDRALVRPWLRAGGMSDAVDAPIPLDATAELARVADSLEPARVRAHYPGVWLADRVWATHGHYLDRHLLPEGAFGIARGLLGQLPRDGATPLDYEQAGGASRMRAEGLLTRWLPQPLAGFAESAAEFLRAATMPGVQARVLGPRFAPLTSMLLGMQMRHAAIPALARVVHRLGVDADWVVFGHVHRCGPLAGDDPQRWAGPTGAPRILNTGSWVYEPLLVNRVTPPHPYWPGGAVLLDEGAEPRAVGLLDHLAADALR
jgi:UDP-2,3-diacylglucosamine pyrophosphatase LpxH